jgi:hypothetical protein
MRCTLSAGAVLALAIIPFAPASAARDALLMDCKQLPAEAAREIPDPVADWTRLDCRAFGQLFVQQRGWQWRYSGSFMQEVMVAGIMGAHAEQSAGSRYFRDIAVTPREGEVLSAMDREFKKTLVSYAFVAGDETPVAGYTLRAVTDVLDIITIHFLQRKDGGMWAVACTPDCRPENVFLVQKAGG